MGNGLYYCCSPGRENINLKLTFVAAARIWFAKFLSLHSLQELFAKEFNFSSECIFIYSNGNASILSSNIVRS